jgi:transposase InsO family protein
VTFCGPMTIRQIAASQTSTSTIITAPMIIRPSMELVAISPLWVISGQTVLNHADGVTAMDLFVVPTISFRLLYGLVIMGHGRRQILWLGVTAHPTAEWIANQLTAACGWEQIPRDLIRDRDACYGSLFRSLGIRDHPTSARSPWQNGYAERLIGSIRRECLDHIVVTGEQHLRHILNCYMEYYNAVRTHLSLGKDAPICRDIQHAGRIEVRPVLGGLHHQYVRI